ncbi:hypothetical protein M9978_01300 [Sphingomonas sp. MG17]|uniref:Transmembrane protein n=1 Tax=Sphingomonas tagetis TaxID=2949092 RepID=A0A9X2HGE0_9SPHN|nr:hypothetical protein [Sphingomonas tagetis]MCP3729052.1 hypothetical protein [Sphingomonas tagetis]
MRREATLDRRTAGHPFRRRMPQVRAMVQKREDDSDLKLFATSFVAFFVCFYTFLL